MGGDVDAVENPNGLFCTLTKTVHLPPGYSRELHGFLINRCGIAVYAQRMHVLFADRPYFMNEHTISIQQFSDSIVSGWFIIIHYS